MDFIINNWYIIIAGIAIAAAIVVAIVHFFHKPTEQQIENLKQWLRFAVTQAEKALGSGTGQLKLRYVYDLAVKQFPWVSVFLSFEQFSHYVDDALAWLKHELATNENLEAYVENVQIQST